MKSFIASLLLLTGCAPIGYNEQQSIADKIENPKIERPANCREVEPILHKEDSTELRALKFAKAWTHGDQTYYDRIDAQVPRTTETHIKYLLEIEADPSSGPWADFWWNALYAIRQLRKIK